MLRPMTEKEIIQLWVDSECCLHIIDNSGNKDHIDKLNATFDNPFFGYNIYSADDLVNNCKYLSKDNTWRRFEVEEFTKEQQILSDFADLLGKHDVMIDIKQIEGSDTLPTIIEFYHKRNTKLIFSMNVDLYRDWIDSATIRNLIKEQQND